MASDVTYSVNIDSPIAVYVQIKNQIQFNIASGRLKPGDTLPSVIEMSAMLNVNSNTVVKSYRELLLLKLVDARRGVGVTITEAAPKICCETARAMAREHLKDSVAECIASGLTAAAVLKVVTRTIDAGLQPYQVGKPGKRGA